MPIDTPPDVPSRLVENIENISKSLDDSFLNSKFRTFFFDEIKFNKLKAKCKSKNIKLNGCLNILSSIALKKLLVNKLSGQNSDKIYFINSVSLRNYLNLETFVEKQSVMCCCINHFCFVMEEKFDVNEPNQWKEKFWIWSQKIQRKCIKDLIQASSLNF